MTVSTIDESQLVAQSLAGDRQAFGRIVARYQNLICSIAYAATGSVAQSEDLAQETFFSAWRQLKELREPAKLRAWLCGIARNLVNNSRRRAVREPTYAAEPIEAAGEAPTPQPPPAEQSISDEEQAILWRSLAEIPEAYREPMVLFYREHRSVESVAEALELSEETVRQRLSRGRKLLHEQVLAFVEGALERSSPGKAFAIAVVAGLPAYTATSSAAAVSVGAAKGGVAAKVAFVAALFNSLLGLLISIPGTFFAVRAALDGTRSTRERAFVARQSAIILLGAAAFTLALVLAVEFTPFLDAQPWAFGVVAVAIPATWTIWLVRRLLVLQRGQAQMRAEDAERNSTDAAPAQEFRS
ncbi:MAG TPA: sigma-70 family RNA polymerase sigma factor, partial [Rudaea sp.]|nr:sigma-70 family RNA polymerase sigma factor [Rudaea sp.]